MMHDIAFDQVIFSDIMLCYVLVSVHTRMYTYVYTYIHTCMHIYIYTYVHKYIYIYIHIYIYICRCICTHVLCVHPACPTCVKAPWSICKVETA